ncbi:MAG: galactokinase family protein [Thermoanaerobaculia bacterium]
MSPPRSIGSWRARLRALTEALVSAGHDPDDGAHAFRVPGRIEVLGKHTDYAGGRSLTMATEPGIRLLAVPREDESLVLLDTTREEQCTVDLTRPVLTPGQRWSVYPVTVARRLAADFGTPSGATVAFENDLPTAAGLSTSSALVVAVHLALATVSGLAERPAFRREVPSPAALAGYLGAVENGQRFGDLPGGEGVGTFGGSEDHTAILCSRPGSLGLYRYAPVRPERSVRLPEGLLFAVGASGVKVEKAGAALDDYNRLSRRAAAAAEAWRRASGDDAPHLDAAIERAGTEAVLAALASEPELRLRAEQFAIESEELVPAAAEALSTADLARFGELVERSQRLAETHLGNQIPETVFLAREARRLDAPAASAFGAGFGGAVWALVQREEAPRFLAAWRGSYERRFPHRAEGARFLLTGAAAPAGPLPL